MQQTNWFLRPQIKNDSELRIICFPYAGGSAATYMSWNKWLPNNVELIAVQPPGRANRMFEPSYSDMNSLVHELLSFFTTIIDRPYILFGHSLGSRIAFELMVQCQNNGFQLPAHFIASGSRGPQIPSRKKNNHLLSDKEFIAGLKGLNGTSKELLENEELMSLCLPLLRADFKLADNYCYSSNAVFDFPISILGGEDDTGITNDDLLSWNDFFSQAATVYMLPGDHFFIESNKQLVAQKVKQIVEKVLSNSDLSLKSRNDDAIRTL